MTPTPCAPRVRVLAVDAWERPFRLRQPFRFGSVTLTHGRQALVRVRLPDGRAGTGYAAETLAAKWFDKAPALSDAQNYDQLRRALELAREAYLAAGSDTLFGLFVHQYPEIVRAGAAQGLNALTSGFGQALLDRAVLDALCRAAGLDAWRALQANVPGMRCDTLVPDLAGFDFDGFLRDRAPVTQLQVRHTVGLADPVVAADLEAGHAGDGLPTTLQGFVAAQELRHFKIKLEADADACLHRLERIAAVLDAIPGPVVVTLDGNEQFDDAEAFAALWQRLREAPALARLLARTAMIEQPIQRRLAATTPMRRPADMPPLLIDESDDAPASFPAARRLGYRGVSSKGCKGIYKSLVNLARCARWNAGSPGDGDRCFMSAEDLTTLPGLCLQQDLAIAALLGVGHIERNAHHYVDGFSGQPAAEAQDFLRAHPDLYADTPAGPRLDIREGGLRFASLAQAGFGTAVVPLADACERMPASRWGG